METIAPSFLIELSSNVQVSRRAIESRTSSNSGHICLLTLELRALERWKNVVDQIEYSFLIGSVCTLQVTRTGINTRTSSISGQIGIFTSVLLVL